MKKIELNIVEFDGSVLDHMKDRLSRAIHPDDIARCERDITTCEQFMAVPVLWTTGTCEVGDP
jgi:hypothetical protein